MWWSILVLINIFALATSRILQRILLKNDKSDPIAFSVVFQLLTALLIAIFALINGFSLDGIENYWMNVVFLSFLYAFANLFLFQAFKTTEASIVTVILTLTAVWAVVGALLFLGESMSSLQLFATLLIVAGTIISLYQNQKWHWTPGVGFAFLSTIFFGLAFVNDAYVFRELDVLSYSALAFFLPALVLMVLFPRKIKEISTFKDFSILWKMTLLCFIYGVSSVSMFAAYQIANNAAQIAPLSATSTVVAAIMAIILLKERDFIMFKLSGAILAVIGAILIQ